VPTGKQLKFSDLTTSHAQELLRAVPDPAQILRGAET
jgi:hypothetical protein